MDDSPAALAAVVADAFVSAHPGALGREARRDLLHRIETAIRTAIRLEREGCAEACAARAGLWSSTAEREGTAPSLRAEARARANESQYLADAIRARA